MMKKSIIFLLVLTMVISAFLVGCKPKEEPVDTPPVDTGQKEETSGKPTEPTGQIIIGNSTDLTGDWLYGIWSNGGADADIDRLISAYPTVGMTFEGEFVVDKTVVKEVETTDNEDGTKTYTWTINDNLVYSDGTPITAKDYVATLALWAHKVVGDLEGMNSSGYRYVGWEEYSKGEAKTFKGVRLLDDYKFSITIAAEHLPFYYDLYLASVSPTQLSFWTDETVEVKDDGDGVYLTENFTLETHGDRLKAARYEARPSSGQYVLKSYDETAKTAVLEVNDKYLGNYEGQKPSIKTIVYKKVSKETQMDELATGGVDIILAEGDGTSITQGLDLVDKGGFSYTSYPRAGYGYIGFHSDFGPTQFKAVRQAIAHLIDRNDFAKAFTGGFGTVVHGPYGESMWFYQENKAELNEKLNPYPYSLEKATQLLVDDGWVYDEKGNEYKEGIRYKKLEDGTLMPLIIEWASTDDNAVSELLVVKLQENPDLAKVGLKINQTLMQWGELQGYKKRNTAADKKYGVPTYHMYNMATNFYPWYNATTTYTTDPELLAKGYNDSFIIDEELDQLGKALALTQPDDREGFKKKAVEYFTKWNDVLPDIPLYSNLYHDFYNDKIKNWTNNPLVNIDWSIIHSYVEE